MGWAEPEFVRKMREEIDSLRAAMLSSMPFLAVLLRKVRIVAAEDIPTAAVNSRDELLVNPRFWEKLNTAQ